MQIKHFKIPDIFIGLILSVILLGCNKDFLQKPPTDSIVDANFYQTDEQVLAASALLYSRVWVDYNDRASYNIGDFRAGTAYSMYNYRDNVLFNTTGLTDENSKTWRCFFVVIAQSNLLIENIVRYAGNGVSEPIRKLAIAEARFMRALAYRYLVMNYGAVPIITDNLTLLSDTSIRRNTVSSVWKFITSEMRQAAEDLPERSIQTGRITKWSAEGMLARFYLDRSGVDAGGAGQRDHSFLDSAKYYAQRVITQSGASLLNNYYDLFLYPYDNNSESLFELQWMYLPSSNAVANHSPAFLAFGPEIANGDGWGSDKSASWWMLKQYEGFETVGGSDPELNGDTLLVGRTLDQRLKATFMLPGVYYPEITIATAGGSEKLTFPDRTGDANTLSIKKYVVGKAEDVGGKAGAQNYDNNTYMMRLAEMYLTYAEAVLGNDASTSDPTALAYVNRIRTRAGLPELAGPLTFDMIFKEWIVEFAMESMAWYNLVRLHYYDKAKAYAILNSQDRGLFAAHPDRFPNPTSWTFRKTKWRIIERKINAYDGNFVIPIPSAELNQAPNLMSPPVDYYSK